MCVCCPSKTVAHSAVGKNMLASYLRWLQYGALVFQVIGGRNSISDTRKIKNKIRSKLDAEQARGTALKKQIADNAEKWIPRLEKSLTDLKDRIRALHLKNAEKSAKCEKFLKGT